MTSEGFEPANPASKRPQTYALDLAANGISHNSMYKVQYWALTHLQYKYDGWWRWWHSPCFHAERGVSRGVCRCASFPIFIQYRFLHRLLGLFPVETWKSARLVSCLGKAEDSEWLDSLHLATEWGLPDTPHLPVQLSLQSPALNICIACYKTIGKA
jgi:hypothetical protein